MEHRCGRRVVLDEVVRLSVSPHAVSVARLRNISSSGAFLQTALHPPLMAPMEMVIDVRYATGARTLTLLAHVVRVAPEGIGVEWNEFDPQVVDALERTAEWASTDSAPAQPIRDEARPSRASRQRTRE